MWSSSPWTSEQSRRAPVPRPLNPINPLLLQKRLQKCNFADFDQFASDVTLVFANAILFNPPDHAVHMCALHLKGEFGNVYYRLLENPVVMQWTYPNVPPARGLQAPMLQDHNSKCQQMIEKICGMALSEAFRDPVDWFAQDLAQYPRVIASNLFIARSSSFSLE